MQRALYPGSFDPPTLGHLDLVVRGAALFDALVVAVGTNPHKAPLFSAEERCAMLREILSEEAPSVEVVAFTGLVVQAARANHCTVLLRGLRTVTDFESEYQMALTNRALEPDIETVFVMPNEKYAYTSSSLVKEVFEMGGDASPFVPPLVAERMREHLGNGKDPS